jgi:hypothetical protein
VPSDVQVIFILGLAGRQNSSASVRLAVLQHTLLERIFTVRSGSQNHDLFILKGLREEVDGR